MNDFTGSSKRTQIVLFGSDFALLESLKPFSAGLPYISYEVGYGPQVTARTHLDAMWATPMMGVEIFGANPPFPLHEAQVLTTPDIQIKQGMPRYGVVGVAVAQDEVRTPEDDLRLVMSALLDAIKRFNSRNADQIVKIGILPEDLALGKLEPGKAFQIIQEVYGQRSSG